MKCGFAERYIRLYYSSPVDTISQQKIKMGTCAWTYDDWRGAFYPPHLPQNQWLEFYARYFPSVEVDSTFYHAPSAKVVGQWAERTPEDFRFSCKMPKEITHGLRLRDCEEKLTEFLTVMEPLRPKLGCILIQLPPTFVPKQDEKALKSFFALLPPSFRFAVEFRHADWHLPRIVHYLEDHGICWAWSDTSALHEQNRAAFEPLPQTTNFLYIRLLGDLRTKYLADGSRKHRYGSLMWPRDSSLESWAIKIHKHLPESENIYLYSGNHFEGMASLTCQRIARLLNIPMELPAAAEDNPQPSGTQMTLL